MRIVSRDEWGAAAPVGPLDGWPADQPSSWTIHYEGVDVPVDEADYADRVRSIQAYHQTHGYYDIAYNFVVAPNGTVYEARGWDYRSAAQVSGNPVSIAVCYIGGPSTPLTDAAASSINALIAERPMEVFPHKHWFNTACPGDIIVGWLEQGRPASGVTPPPVGPMPVPPPVVDARPMVRYGMTGSAVREMQDKLRAHGFDPGISDSVYGPQTQRALLGFQRHVGIAADGICGPITWSHLDGVPAGAPARLLSYGMVGDDVRQVQVALSGKGVDVGPHDGIWGDRTQAGVVQFQRNAGLAADGIVGPLNRAALGI